MSPLSRQLQHVWSLDPAATAIEYKGEKYLWGDLKGLALKLDKLLTSQGLGEGAAIGIFLRNRPGIVATIVGVLATGRAIVSINPHYPPETLAGEVRDLNVAVLVGDESDWKSELIRAEAAKTGTMGISIRADGKELDLLPGLEKVGPGAHHIIPEGIALEILTSGTTGKPKRIQARYRALADAVLPPGAAEGVLPEALKPGVAMMANPLVHVSGIFGVLTSFSEGRTIVMFEKFDVNNWVETVYKHKLRFAPLAPTPMRMVLDAKVPKEKLASLRAVRSATAPLPVDTQRDFEATYGVPVLIQYTATEFLGGISGWTAELHKEFMPAKLGSVGRNHPGVQIRIVDPATFAEVPTGETGLIEVLATKRFGPDTPWVRTTDLGWMDPDGFLYVVGRADDVIIRGGFKVSLPDVSDYIRSHPAVKDASVLGIPDARLGTVPVCAVELHEKGSVSEADLLQHCRAKLLAYQIPVTLKIVDVLPRTASMKVDRAAVRAMFV
jgi:long-chain acyl-CoA synthetase